MRICGGGPTGVSALGHSLNIPVDTLEDEIEPFLLRIGFLLRTPRGRMITGNALSHLQLSLTNPLEERAAVLAHPIKQRAHAGDSQCVTAASAASGTRIRTAKSSIRSIAITTSVKVVVRAFSSNTLAAAVKTGKPAVPPEPLSQWANSKTAAKSPICAACASQPDALQLATNSRTISTKSASSIGREENIPRPCLRTTPAHVNQQFPSHDDEVSRLVFRSHVERA